MAGRVHILRYNLRIGRQYLFHALPFYDGQLNISAAHIVDEISPDLKIVLDEFEMCAVAGMRLSLRYFGICLGAPGIPSDIAQSYEMRASSVA